MEKAIEINDQSAETSVKPRAISWLIDALHITPYQTLDFEMKLEDAARRARSATDFVNVLRSESLPDYEPLLNRLEWMADAELVAAKDFLVSISALRRLFPMLSARADEALLAFWLRLP
jgi:hypothetical protein